MKVRFILPPHFLNSIAQLLVALRRNILKKINYMHKTIGLIVVVTLLIFAFFAGVKYSASVKNHASWLFEPKEEEVELPDLSNENGGEIGATIDENGENLNGGEMAAPQEAAPMDSLDTNPTHQPQAAPAR